MRLQNDVTDEDMHDLCARLPALTHLELVGVTSKKLTANGLRAMSGLTALTYLNLTRCSNVTDAGVRELGGHTKLTELYLHGCSLVTNEGVQELRGLTKLTELCLNYCSKVTDKGLKHVTSPAIAYLGLFGTSTTQAGRDELKAALPALVICS